MLRTNHIILFAISALGCHENFNSAPGYSVFVTLIHAGHLQPRSAPVVSTSNIDPIG